MMTTTMTCEECGSAVAVYPSVDATSAVCEICQKETPVKFNEDHMMGVLKDCPCCDRKDFYQQKDFNRMIGVGLFVIAAIASIWIYGISLIVLWLMDMFLFKKLGSVAVCYKCQTIFRDLSNMDEIYPYNHEMNDRIVYSDHDFGGEQLEH